MIIDVFSRYVVGWRVADRASDTLSGRLLAETIVNEYLSAEGLTVHADRGLVDAVQAGGIGTTLWRCSRPTSRATPTTAIPRGVWERPEPKPVAAGVLPRPCPMSAPVVPCRLGTPILFRLPWWNTTGDCSLPAALLLARGAGHDN